MSARSLNKVMLIGNLTRDPEVRYTPNGTAVCTFGLATNRSWTPSDGGETQEETEYHRIVCWSKLAEICGQLLFKGRKIYCEGRLQTRRWTGQDGQERNVTEVVVDNMIVLSPPKSGYPADQGAFMSDEASTQYSNQGGSQQVASQATTTVSDPEDTTSDTTDAEKVSDKKETNEVNVDDIPF